MCNAHNNRASADTSTVLQTFATEASTQLLMEDALNESPVDEIVKAIGLFSVALGNKSQLILYCLFYGIPMTVSCVTSRTALDI